VVPTAHFSGIADYALRLSYLSTRNWPIIDRQIAASDLLWLRLPASNGLLALAAARRHRVAHFSWIAGSVRDVVAAQARGTLAGAAARALARGYDAVSNLAAQSGPSITLDDELHSSIVSGHEVELTRAAPAGPRGAPWLVAWAGRMAPEKGLDVLIHAIGLLLADDVDVSLLLVGDGPARDEIERRAGSLPADRVRLAGHVGDRATYFELLREADVFALPSGAEGMPKVLVEAMAAGLPVVATDAGAVDAVLAHGERGVIVPPGDAAAMARGLRELLGDPGRRAALRAHGLDYAADHTAERQAERLVAWLQSRFPDLLWPA